MRLQSFVNESSSKEWEGYDIDFQKAIEKDCKPYLSLIGSNVPLYRGGDYPFSIGKVSTWDKRQPSGTDQESFAILNRWLRDNGHLGRDKNVMICSSNRGHAGGFGPTGQVVYVFPIGPIRYSWIEAKDINMHSYRTGWTIGILNTFRTFYKLKAHKPNYMSLLPDYLKGKGYDMKKPFQDYFHTNEGFNEAYSKGYEMWIECKEYYVADTYDYLWINKKLEKLAKGGL